MPNSVINTGDSQLRNIEKVAENAAVAGVDFKFIVTGEPTTTTAIEVKEKVEEVKSPKP